MNRLSVATRFDWRHQSKWFSERQELLFRLMLIAAIFLGAFVLGRQPSILYLGAIIGAVGLLVIMRWPPLGVLLTIIGGFAIAQTGPSGINVAVVGMAALLGIWIADMVIRRHRIAVVDWPTTRAGLALSGVAILAFLVGLLPWFPTQHAPVGAQLAGVALYVLSFGVFLVVSNQVKTIRWLEIITYGFIAFASLHLLGYVVPGAGTLTDRLFPYGSTGSLFLGLVGGVALQHGAL
ncbi:MAG: hypothetical protein IPK16_11275 [Anaerolineales bacterium]|nr:hypothetical protein [Anaerolineales bacterium]